MQSLSIVIPIYNEEGNIGPLVTRISEAMSGWEGTVEILFVEDGSSDRTLELLKESQAKDSRIRIAHFHTNMGQTAAMAAGFRLARGEILATLDADLQNDPMEIPRLAEMLDGWDLVCGVRTRRKDNLWKRISSLIGNAFRNWATGDNITDTGCTLKVYRRECLDGLELYKGMHRFLPTLIKMRGYRVTQVPVSHHPRFAGETKYGTWGRLVKGLEDVWAVRWMKRNHISFESKLQLIERESGAYNTVHMNGTEEK
ncbi:MAG: glycosyltransferase [Acidobacteria bacterium]|nr:MAG: glycosyltransferase [Acidobacteriota bacterium]